VGIRNGKDERKKKSMLRRVFSLRGRGKRRQRN
jgi:hypothetical protein